MTVKATESRRGKCIVPRVSFKNRAYYIGNDTTTYKLSDCTKKLPTRASVNKSPFTFKQVVSHSRSIS